MPSKRFVLCEIPLLRRVLTFFYSSQSAWVGHQNELLRAEHEQDGGNHPRSIASIRRANTAEPSNIPGFDAPELHPTSIGKLCPSETSASKVHLVCSWRAILGDEVIRGEHYLRAFSIRPMTTVKGCPVHATANYPSALCHDFSEGPAVVSVVVTLRNQLLDAPVSISLVTKVNPSCELIGLDQSHISLEPDETMEVSFDALIPWEACTICSHCKSVLGKARMQTERVTRRLYCTIYPSNGCSMSRIVETAALSSIR